MQLECPASAWKSFLKLEDFDQKFHLSHCLFDFIGAGNPREYAPFVMNNETISAFMDTIKYRDNHQYGMSRLQQAGLSENIDNAFPISRLVAMARIFTEDKKDKLMKSISLMSEETKTYLFKELANPVTAKEPAILNQVINSENEKLVSKILCILAYLFKKARKNIHDNAEIQTFNLIDFASSVKDNPVEAIANVEASGMQAMSGGWKWTKENTLDKEQIIPNSKITAIRSKM